MDSLQAQARARGILLQRFDPRRAMQLHACRHQRRPEPVDQQVVLDDPAQLAARHRRGLESQFAAAGRVPHPHAPVGAGARLLHLRPHAQRIQ